MSKTRLSVSAMLPMLVALVAIAGCGGSDNNNSTTNATTQATTPTTPAANDHGTKNFAGKTSGEVEMYDFYFEPTTIKGKPGQTLTLELKNAGTVEHNFSIADQKVDADLEPGKTAKVKVKFPTTGTFEFFCSYHKAKGMVGTLEENSGSSSSSSSGSSSSGGGSSSSGSSSGSGGGTTTQSSGGGSSGSY